MRLSWSLIPVSPLRLQSRVCWSSLWHFLFHSGLLATTLFDAIGHHRSRFQPDDDPRPFMQSGVGATLGGNHPSSIELINRAFNLKEEVSSVQVIWEGGAAQPTSSDPLNSFEVSSKVPLEGEIVYARCVPEILAHDRNPYFWTMSQSCKRVGWEFCTP